MGENSTEQIFWLDKWEGDAQGGVYTRCNLNDCIKILNEKGAKIVGIKLDLESKWNLELIMEKQA